MMNGSASVLGLLLLLSAAVARAQAPAPEPDAGAPAPEPEPEPEPEPAPPAAEASPRSSAPEPEPPPRARVRWTEPGGDSDQLAPAIEEAEDDAEEPAAGEWSLQGFHLVLAAERVTSLLAWSNVSKAAPSNEGTSNVEDETSGVDIALLGAGGANRTASGVPRLGFDVVLDIGFSVGGSLGYMASVDGQSAAELDSSSDSTSELPDQSISIFAPRVGLMLVPLHNVGVWLRGGITRIGTSETVTFSSDFGSSRQEWDATLWQLSLDPQLVLVAAPRVAITVACLLDIGLSGTIESRLTNSGASFDTDLKSSAYGVSAGLAAIF